MSHNKSFSVTPIPCGVPQGSVLGPLLFAVYINNISDALTYCRYHLYADDLQMYLSTSRSELHQAINKVNHDLDSLGRWSLRHEHQPKKIPSYALSF